MAQNFSEDRNVELSLMYYLEQNLASSWTGLTVVKTFKSAYATEVDLPIVCVRLSDTQTTRKEIGADTLENRHLLIIDIFSSSDGQRLDLKTTIKNLLSVGWVHYNHSRQVGDATGVLVRVANGLDYITGFVSDNRLDFGDQVDQKDRFRHSISVRVRKST